MVKQNKGKTIEEFIENDHVYCKAKWCNVLKAQLAGKSYNHPDEFCTRSTTEWEKYIKTSQELRHTTETIFVEPKYAPIHHTNQRNKQP